MYKNFSVPFLLSICHLLATETANNLLCVLSFKYKFLEFQRQQRKKVKVEKYIDHNRCTVNCSSESVIMFKYSWTNVYKTFFVDIERCEFGGDGGNALSLSMETEFFRDSPSSSCTKALSGTYIMLLVRSSEGKTMYISSQISINYSVITV